MAKITDGMTNEEALRALDEAKYGAGIDAMNKAKKEFERAKKRLTENTDAVLEFFGKDTVFATLEYRTEHFDRKVRDEYDNHWESPEGLYILATWMLEETADVDALDSGQTNAAPSA